MAGNAGATSSERRPGRRGGWAAKLTMLVFFCVHYGAFMLAHLLFLTVLAGGTADVDPGAALSGIAAQLDEPAVWLALAAFAGSHAFSFAVHYVGRGEFRRTTTEQQMIAIYPRILLMHVAILAGAAIVLLLGIASGVLLALVAAKTALDLRAHRRSHVALSRPGR